MPDLILGNFAGGMDRRSRRGGKDGAQQLWSLVNGYINAKRDIVPRPGLREVATVTNSVGLYGFDGQLHVFYGDPEDYTDPNLPIIKSHLIRYPLGPITIYGQAPAGAIGTLVDYTYQVTDAVGDYTVVVLSGTLPPGTTMDSAGRVAGQYTTKSPDDDPYTWTVQVTDSIGNVATFTDSAAVAGRTYHDTIVDQGPTAYWRFNESSGTVMAEERGLYPGVYNTTGITLGTAGLLVGDTNKSVSGGGTARVGTVANTLGVWQNEDVTITAMFKAVAIGTTMCLVQQPDAPYYGTTLSVDDIGALVGTYVSQNSGTGTVVNVTGPNKVVAGNIYHLAYRVAQVDVSHAVTDFFLNGVNISTQPAQDRRKPPTSQLVTGIGAFNLSGLSNFLNGTEDELAIFGRALTDTEILQQYEASI